MNLKLITFEILLIVVAPLLLLYLRGRWPLRAIIPCLLAIPVLWYLTYSPMHELSHVVGTYLVGGKVTYIKLIPSFWHGEFGRAWITPVGVTQSWQQLIMTAAPYILDGACIAIGITVLHRDFSKNPFVVGLIFMLLCLRPAFDFTCETIAFVSGDMGDIYHIKMIIGNFLTWLFILLSIGSSLISIFVILRRFTKFPETSPNEASIDPQPT